MTNIKKNFYEKCYSVLLKVPKGRVTTYKEISNYLGTNAYRAVGTAMNKNPYAPKVPCHRVVNTNGKIGGFASGCENKIKILKKEGVLVDKKTNKIINFEKVLFKF